MKINKSQHKAYENEWKSYENSWKSMKINKTYMKINKKAYENHRTPTTETNETTL